MYLNAVFKKNLSLHHQNTFAGFCLPLMSPFAISKLYLGPKLTQKLSILAYIEQTLIFLRIAAIYQDRYNGAVYF